MTPNKLIKNHFINKVFVSSEFMSKDQNTFYDALGNEIDSDDFSPFGKKIVNASFGFNEGRENAGLLLYFEDWSYPFFFYDVESIIVE